MRNKAYTPAQIVNKLRQIERLRGSGKAASAACKRAGVTESVYRRWHKQYGGLAKRVEKLEQNLKATAAELTNTLEQQTATAEILRVISRSPTDIQPVLDAVAESAARLCDANDVVIRRVDGDMMRMAAHFGAVPVSTETIVVTIYAKSVGGRAILERRTVHVNDILDPHAREDYSGGPFSQREGVGDFRTMLAVPLLREDTAIGIILIRRPEVRPFSDKQIKLLETFAAQAVIAIENVRLFNETKEALEQQTATAEVLKLISRTTFEIQPVLDTLVRCAAELCEAQHAIFYRLDSDGLRPETWHNVAGEYVAFRKANPIPVSTGSPMGQVALTRQPVHVHDALAYPNYASVAQKLGEWRTVVGVPVLREGELIGTIGVFRRETRPFTEKQVALLKTFADQAVIAIENVRLFTELQARNAEVTESLEQQTATAEILKVISSSPTDIQPVFDAILEKAIRLCDAHMGNLGLYDGETYQGVAQRGASAEYAKFLSERRAFRRPPEGSIARMIAERQPIYIADRKDTSDYRDRRPPAVAMVELAGARSYMAVPMLKEGRVVGAIQIYRPEVRPFTQKQIDLVSTFASQAVIAIENVRLFNETKEALEQQTVISEILRVIGSSPTDTQPVFDAIVKGGVRLFGGMIMSLRIIQGDHSIIAARSSPAHEDTDNEARPLTDTSEALSLAIARREVVQVADVFSEDWVSAWTRKRAELNGWRAMVCAPMLRDGRAIGAVNVLRQNPGPFTNKEVALLKTFADQAVIAIENVRLFNEIQDKNHQLEVASRHKSEFLASMSHELRTPLNAILGFNEMIIHGLYGEVPPDMKTPLDDIQSSGKHLLRLINNVLDLAKIEAGRMELVLADYSIQDTVESVRSALRPLAAEKGLEFVVTVPLDMPLVYGDSGRIMQCLVNLAGNALKFTKAGKVEILAHHHDDRLTCCVADTGVGIPADKIGGLFTEFKQTDATIAQEYGGTGLGLSITKQFIEMHGGRIWVESEVGQGSRFTFEIPLRAAAQAQAGAQA